MPTIRSITANAIAVLVGAYVCMFIVTRASIFAQSYDRAKLERTAHETFANICASHAELREVDSERCHERTMLARVSPAWTALLVLGTHVHSCGAIPCTDVFGILVDKSSGAMIYAALAMAAGAVAYTLLSRIASPLAQQSVQHAYVKDANYTSYIEQQPSTHRQNYARLTERTATHGNGDARLRMIGLYNT